MTVSAESKAQEQSHRKRGAGRGAMDRVRSEVKKQRVWGGEGWCAGVAWEGAWQCHLGPGQASLECHRHSENHPLWDKYFLDSYCVLHTMLCPETTGEQDTQKPLPF